VGSHLLVYRKEFLSLKLFHPRVEARGFLVSYAPRTKLTKVIKKKHSQFANAQTVDKVYFMDAVYSLFFYNRFMKTNARSDSYDV
ncbi:hypothetical protein LIZ91_22070, partial [Enterococcus avium]|nr:hypothetical protein [Enterococcus avium]